MHEIKSGKKLKGYQDVLNLQWVLADKLMNIQNRNSEVNMAFSIRSRMMVDQLVLYLFNCECRHKWSKAFRACALQIKRFRMIRVMLTPFNNWIVRSRFLSRPRSLSRVEIDSE